MRPRTADLVRRLGILLVLFASFSPALAQRQLEGVVVDNATGTPLPYAQIRARVAGVGTITNEDGQFSIWVPGGFGPDTLTVTYIGFQGLQFPMESIPEGIELDIRLVEQAYEIDPVLITSIDPLDLIRNAVAAIPVNYSNRPAQMKAFFRELIREDDSYIGLWEAVLDIYKYAAKDESLGGGRIKMVHGRLRQEPSKIDTGSDEIMPYTSDGPHDIIQNPVIGETLAFHFMKEKYFDEYDYKITGLVKSQGRELFKISILQKPKEKKRLYKATVFIDSESYAIASISYELNREIKRYDIDQYLTLGQKTTLGMARRFGFDVLVLEENGRTDYRLINGRWHLDFYQKRGLIHLITPGKISGLVTMGKKITMPKNLRYFFIRELVVTELDFKNLNKFSDEELLDPEEPVGEQLGDYDDAFWDQYNFLKPTASLREIGQKMGKDE